VHNWKVAALVCPDEHRALQPAELKAFWILAHDEP
jgi:hypothetical protein